jgi:ketosteroid isomerase-like protein
MTPAALAFLAALAAAPSDADQIRAGRERSNAAIAAHDAGALTPLYTPDATVVRGSSGVALTGAGAITASLASAFRDPDFVTYRRTPDTVTLSEGGLRAAESGRWVGTWRKPDGEMRLSGVYLAMWVKAGGGWRLKSEAFVSLTCEGSRSCPDVM